VLPLELAIAKLCSEMRFLSHKLLRVVLVNTKQELIKVASVSQGTLNEALAHPREVFKPVIAFSAFAFIMVHNHPSGDPSASEADLRLTRRILVCVRFLFSRLRRSAGWPFRQIALIILAIILRISEISFKPSRADRGKVYAAFGCKWPRSTIQPDIVNKPAI
jgi:hypothetical protein